MVQSRFYLGALARVSGIGAVCLVTLVSSASGQWSTTHEQFYRQASHNWEFRRRYPNADRFFNALADGGQ